MSNVAEPMEQVRADFDRIAELPPETWGHNLRYHQFLLTHLPKGFETGLDVGCGTGALARRLAERGRRIDAIDLSPRMIEVARKLSSGLANINYNVADVLEWPGKPKGYDVIVSVAALHHMSIERVLPRLRDWLRPGGVMAILDLVADEGWADMARSVAAAAINVGLRRWNTGQSRPSPEARRAWDEHFARDVFLTWKQVQSSYRSALPGCRVRRHLFWRYSVVWRKPGIESVTNPAVKTTAQIPLLENVGHS